MSLRDRTALCLYRLKPLIDGHVKSDAEAAQNLRLALSIVEFTGGYDFDTDESEIPGFKERFGVGV